MAANFIATPSLPVVTLSATGAFVGTGAEFDLPGVVTLSATLESNYWRGTPVLPAVSLAATMLTGMGLTAAFTLYPPTLSSTLLQDAIFSGSPSLPVVDLEAQALIGGLLTATFSTPVVDMAALVISDGAFTAVFTLPKVQLAAEIAELAAAGFRTWVVNLSNSALSEYGSEFAFNSYAVFNGQVLACGSTGVVVLGTQSLDGATAITATAKTGQSDFGTSLLKRVPRLYVAGSQSGDILFRTITSEDGRRTYRLIHNNVTGNQQRRVPIGRGPKSRYFQYEIENEAGADFNVQSVMAYPSILRRRVM